MTPSPETAAPETAEAPLRLYAAVATYRRPKTAQAAIDALLKQSRPPDGVILVENSEEPELESAFDSEPLVEYVATRSNTGAAGGFAIGAEVALARGATHVVFVDDDCVLRQDALARLEYHLAGGLRDAVVGPVVVGPGTERLVWPIQRPDGRLYGSLSELPAHPLPARHLAFHGLTVGAEALRKAGGPRKDLFFGGPDVEFGLRLAHHGYSIFYCPDAVAEHHEVYYRHFRLLGPRKLPTGTPGHRYYVLRNRLLMWRLYRRDSFVAGVAKEIVRESVGAVLSGDRRLHRLALLGRGIRDGLFGHPHRELDNAVPLER